jgi:hypothetical protein
MKEEVSPGLSIELENTFVITNKESPQLATQRQFSSCKLSSSKSWNVVEVPEQRLCA